MFLLLSSILFYFILFTVTRASLQWPQAYHFKATLKIPSANLVEPYEVWSNGINGHHKFDFYKGMSQMYQRRHGQVNNVVQFQYYWVNPEATSANHNHLVCRQLNENSSEVKRLSHYLPPTYNFKETGPDGNHTTKWEFQFTEKKYGAVFKYALWTTGKSNDWVPVRYEYRMIYDGRESDFIEHSYEEFSRSKPDSDVYKIPSDLRCSTISTDTEKDVDTFLDVESPILLHDMPKLFERFKVTHNKQYKNNKEHFRRFTVFLKNIRYIQSVNRRHGSYKLAVNRFADLTEDELSLLSGTKIRPEIINLNYSFLDNDRSFKNSKDFDWRWYGAVSPVKDQTFLCGSCYAFTTAAAVESAAYVSKGCQNLEEISEQALIDCSRGQNGKGNQGCNGGYLSSSLKWVQDNGIPLRKDYGPYLAMEGYCHLNQSRLMHINKYIRLSNDTKSIKASLRQHGPLATVMYVPGSLFFYRSGVYDDETCLSVPGSQTHAVLVVGYGKTNGKRYWLVKNSWGSRWGDQGYFKLDMKNNLCGITNLVYAIVNPDSNVKQCKKVKL